MENQIASLLIRHGIEGFKPRLKNAETKLCELRTFRWPIASDQYDEQLKLQLNDAALFGLAFHVPPFRQRRRLDRHRLDGMDELANDGRIDAPAAKHHTPPLSEHHARTIASIDGLADPPGRARCVIYRQATTTTATDQEPDEKSSAPTAGLGAVTSTVGVGRELPLVALELGPVDVSVVMPLQEDLAVLEGAMMAVGLAGPTVDDLGAVLALTVGIGARVEGVLEDRDG